ncbi:MAG: hypothetical protein AAF970_08655 [Bacteroidota bacterium]
MAVNRARIWNVVGLLWLSSLFVVEAHAQPLRGMVWEPPADLGGAVQAMIDMEQAGVELLRTPVIVDERLLVLADTLGLQVYQDLPLHALSARQLQRQLESAQGLLAEVLERARGHASARHVGLAINVDTSHPDACPVLDALARQVREAGLQSYYVTRFGAEDVCLRTTDLVLLDVFGEEGPASVIETVRRVATETTVGVGALGTWVQPSAQGLGQPHSAAWQARYLEARLPGFLADEALSMLFVDRWQDPAEIGAPGRAPAQWRSGLRADTDVERPAYAVVQGLYRGRQRVFAFDASPVESMPFPWQATTVWMLIGVLAFTFTRVTTLQQMVPRYFGGHAFYREAIRRGRDLPVLPTVLLYITQALAVGAAASVVTRLLREHAATAVLLSWWPTRVQVLAWSFLYDNLLVAASFALLYALVQLWWVFLLSLLSRRLQPLSVGQVLILVVWPQWTLWVAAGVLLVWPPPPSPMLGWVGGLLAAGGLLLLVAVGSVRTLHDYVNLLRPSAGTLVMGTLLYPLTLLFMVLAMLALRHVPELGFLARLVRLTG